jgi:predicted anti-sigma-YlaC factor YlaD
MDCQHFDRRLDALLDGTCSPEEWQRAEAHLSGCARCRQLFDALGGRAGFSDDTADALLTEAILARTSGSPCVAARDRLCDFVDDVLPAVDRGLVEGHLHHCQACSALAGALARTAAVLPSFAELEPPASLASAVLAATSRRAIEPGIGERVAAWFERAAMRPRFSVGVAYAATLLILLLVGDPVQAVRRTMGEGAVYLQPALVAVGERIVAGVDGARRIGADTVGAMASLAQRPEGAATGWDAGLSGMRQWLVSNFGAPLAGVIERVSGWIRAAMDALIRLVRPEPQKESPSAPSSPAALASPTPPARTEPFRAPLRLS